MDFDEIFAPVVKMTSIRTVLRIVTSMDLEVKQLDVKTAVFLHGDLEEEIYMQQSGGFEEKGKENRVMQATEKLVRAQARTPEMVPEIRVLP